jgi:hypothetical protein
MYEQADQLTNQYHLLGQSGETFEISENFKGKKYSILL